MRLLSYLLLIIIFVIMCVLAVLNADFVSFNYVLGIAKLPLILLLFIVFSLGIITGVVLITLTRRKRKKKLNVKVVNI